MIPSVLAMALQARTELDSAIQLARQNSPILALARADLQMAQSDLRISQSALLPKAVLSGWASTGTDSGAMGGSPDVMPAPFMILPNGSFSVANLSMMVPLYAESLRSKVGASAWQMKAAKSDYIEAVADMDLKVTEGYLRLQLSRRVVDLKKAAVQASSELVRSTNLLWETGKGIQASVQRSESEHLKAERDLRMAQNQSAKAEIDLNEMIGLALDHSWLVASTPTLETAERSLDQWIQLALQTRAIRMAAEDRLRAQRSDLSARRSEGKPQLYGGVMADRTSRADMGGVTGALVLSIPILDGGRIVAETKQGRALVAKAEAQLRMVQLQIEREVRQAWLDVQTAQANLDSSESAVKSAQSSYEIVVLRVQAGKSIPLEQMDGLTALNEAQADALQAQFELRMAKARLNRAMGGSR